MWPILADQCGLTYTPIEAAGHFECLTGRAVGIVSGAGVEEEIEPALRQTAARQRGAIELAAVGGRPDHRLAVTLVRAGAATYFALPEDLSLLASWVRERADTLRADVRTLLLTSMREADANDVAPPEPGCAADPAIPFPATIAAITRAAAHAMLGHCGGNKSEAARRLGISRPRLQRLLDAASANASGFSDEAESNHE
jgi:DNA-binding NtrC family response regulator